MQTLLQWRIPILAALAALTLLFWYLVYFRAMAPQKRTLEWIAELPPLSRVTCCPLHGRQAAALAAAAVLGIGACLLRARAVSADALLPAAVSAAAALLFCLQLLLLHGDAAAALYGTALLLACGQADAALACALAAMLLLLLTVAAARPGLRLLALLAALGAAAGALWCSGALRLDGGVTLTLAAGLPQAWNLPALLAASAPAVELVQGIRLHRAQSLCGAVLGLAALAFLFLGLPQLAYAGALAALCGTFAAAARRGAHPVLAAATLFICILCST